MSSNPVTRTDKGNPLSHNELDENFLLLKQLLERTHVSADGTGAIGTWSISITGNASGITSINPISLGGTGADSPEQALINLGAYPANNPSGYMTAQALGSYIPTRMSLGISQIDNTSDENKPLSEASRINFDKKENKNNKNASDGYAGKSGHNLVVTSAGGLFSYVVSSATAERQYILPDKDIVIAGLSDIPEVTKQSLGINKVENFSVSEILNALTADDVSGALGFVPQDPSTASNDAGAINSGTLHKERLPALTGDVTHAVGTGELVLTNTGVTAATYGDINKIPVFSVDAKGRILDVIEKTIDISDTRFRSIALTGLQVTLTSPISATDTILTGFGKTQKQINDLLVAGIARKVPLVGHRYHSNGFHITTSIDYSLVYGDYWILEITGNTGDNGLPYDYRLQGCVYNGGMSYISGINKGKPITGVILFNLSGKLHFWFPAGILEAGFNVMAYTVSGGESFVNKVTAITDNMLPGGRTKEYSVDSFVVTALNSSNVNQYVAPALSAIDVMIYS